MAKSITNYDGSVSVTPRRLVTPNTVEELRKILRDRDAYPSPVRAMGSYHSLTPCASSEGTMIDMSGMKSIIRIDKQGQTFTAQAGLQFIEASHALREQDLQFMTNIEIGNMTLGSAACCHSKDALDGIEFGQVSSYVIAMKWVAPNGDLAEASEAESPELMRKMRSSYGLCGVIYEVTFRVKPVEAIHFTYLPRPIDELTQQEVDEHLSHAEGLVCWTVGRTVVFQTRQKVNEPNILSSLMGAARRRLWSHTGAFGGHLVDQFVTDKKLRNAAQQGGADVIHLLYSTLRLLGGITLLAPDKTIDYRKTIKAARYAFTFWAFPKAEWLANLRAYLDFADEHHRRTGFRCNMPLGAYFVRGDRSSLLSYTHDGDIFSIDPIHSSTNNDEWHEFLRRFNDFAYKRGGIPLLNQSPFVERKHVEAAFGQRWFEFAEWVKSTDPEGRMLNPFFAALLPERAGMQRA